MTIESIEAHQGSPGQLLEHTITENCNWASWHLNQVVFPLLRDIDLLLPDNLALLGEHMTEVKTFVGLQSTFLSSPHIEALVREKFVRTEAHHKQISSEKPSLDLELAVRGAFGKVISAVLGLIN